MVRGVPEAVWEKIALIIVPDRERMKKIHPYMSVQKLPLMVNLQQKVRELILSITSYLSNLVIKYFKLVYKNCGYGKFIHRYYLSPIHLHIFWGMANFTEGVLLCADLLCSDPQILKI